MSEIENITDGGRPRRWSAAEKLRIVAETIYDGKSISAVARLNGVAPDLLYRWRKPMLEEGCIGVAEDDSVNGNRTVREMESRIRELERQLGRKTMEVKILKEALDKSRAKKPNLLAQSLRRGGSP
ncbi:transposase [Paracoccus homiensis]|uniref:Transposase n=1 Tax=Paracoccus homiensis TaxID=364199 RepID=A0A1I0GNT2_9RHOB|nr:transposase [Paracoccus homiensis]